MVSPDYIRKMEEEFPQMEIRRRQIENLREHTKESQSKLKEHLRQMEELKLRTEEQQHEIKVLRLNFESYISS